MGPSGFAAWKWGLVLVMVLGMWGCAQPAPRTVVVTVGGMGFSQMHDLRMALERECPEAKVISAGMWDAYKADIKRLVQAEPRTHVILIGHSFGCGAIDEAANGLPRVDLAVFIDPAWSDFKLSKQIDRYLWFKRSDIGIEREANIGGASSPETIKGGHNDIPHSQELIAQVVAEVKRVEKEDPAGQEKGPPQMANAAEGRGPGAP